MLSFKPKNQPTHLVVSTVFSTISMLLFHLFPLNLQHLSLEPWTWLEKSCTTKRMVETY